MKNFKKVLAVFVLAVLCFTLCSCDKLDELREKQAFFNEQGIIYKDTLYKGVGMYDNINYNYTNHEFLKVTDPGVPVLMSAFIGWDYYLNEDGTIITGGYDDECYIREDKYDSFMKSIENGIDYIDFGFDYYDVALDENTDYILTDSEKQLFLSCLTTPYNKEFGIDDELYLFEQSDNGLFRKSNKYSVVDSSGIYYIVEYDNDYNIKNAYQSTKQASEMFDNFFNKAYAIVNYDY